MTKEIEDHIADLKEKGFVIKLPGGTARQGDIASFGSIIKKRYSDEGRFIGYKILVIPYLPKENRGTLTKILDNEKVFPEVKEQVLEREVIEETLISLAKAIYMQIASQSFDDKRPEHKGKQHTQYLFIVTHYDDSNIRTLSSPSEKHIGIPFWMNLTPELEDIIDPSHRWMIVETRNHLGWPFLRRQGTKKDNPALASA